MVRVDLAATALILIALGIGYIICLKASKEGSKIFLYGGYVIGGIILVLALMLTLGDVVNRIKRIGATSRRRTTRTITAPQLPTLPRRAVGITQPETAK